MTTGRGAARQDGGDRHAVVVGSGPNGLAAAVALAGAGWSVRVHEAAEVIGGGTRTEALTLPGFRHDVCSAVHPMGAGSPFFATLPLGEHGLEWVRPPVHLAHPFDDGTAAALRSSTADTAATLGRDGKAYRRLLEPFVPRWRQLFEDALAPPLRWPRHPLLMARLGVRGLRSATGLAAAAFEDGRARAFFLGLAAHTLLPLDRPPTAAFGLMLAIAGHGPGWPIARGGSRSIADALAGVLRGQGGRIVTEAPVGNVDDLPPADAVLLDLTPRQVLEVAGHRLPDRYRRRLGRFRYAPGVFKVDWALSEPIPWTAAACREAGTVHVGGGPEAIARSADAAWNGRLDEAPYVILAQPSLFDPSRAPRDRHTAWAYCHVPHGDTRNRTAAIERQVERFAPGFGDAILARSTMNTAALEDHNPNLVGGDIAGGVQDLAQLFFRPAPTFDPYAIPAPGLFLCSASTPPGGGVHGMCGWHASRSVLGRLGAGSGARSGDGGGRRRVSRQ
jgi:phytoene dehydrogenase-like protein